MRRAVAKARDGDAPLALTHLALAGAGRLTEPRDDARRLFIANGLLKAGVAPATILAASSATARLTPKQEVAFAEIESSGATIVGAGKPGFPGGTIIPATPVEVIRPSNLDDLSFWTPP